MVEEPKVWEFVDNHYEEIMRKHVGIEGPFKIVPEYTLPNGQRVDRVIIGTDRKILALIECKGTVGTNEFVGGIGQAFQGALHIKKNIRNNMHERAISFLIVPSDMGNKLPLGMFDFSNIKVLLADLKTGTTVEYAKGDYVSNNLEEWITINPYYFRDCSLEGVYFYLKMILRNSANQNKMTLMQMEKEVRKIRDVSKKGFFGDIRNNHIVPSVLGFYDPTTKNLTVRGYEFAKKSFLDFCRDMVLGEFGEYSRVVFLAILTLNKNKIKVSTEEISSFIKKIYDGKKVTYLFDPDGGNRNLLTMIRMLETIGAIERTKEEIKINYFPLDGMPFKMLEFNKGYRKDMEFWFKKFNFDF